MKGADSVMSTITEYNDWLDEEVIYNYISTICETLII